MDTTRLDCPLASCAWRRDAPGDTAPAVLAEHLATHDPIELATGVQGLQRALALAEQESWRP